METLKTLFEQWAGVPCSECLALSGGGGSRRYYRLTATGYPQPAIGCIGDDLRENEAFFAYCRHFQAKGMPVPELYAVDPDRHYYLLQDLGDQTLYGFLYDKKRQGGGFDAEMMGLYKQALADLAAIQQAGADLDFSLAYPRPAFDTQAIRWDLNYFKYFFLKLVHHPFDEQRLEDDFDCLIDILLQADCNYFMYRDFNPRNIMISATRYPLYYIDFQGGRRGAAQYDVASLLYSAKSDLPEVIRRELLNHYLNVRNIHGAERDRWMHHFWAYLLVRILQTLGAYGYRGLYENKDYFRASIPLAINNLRHLAEEHPGLFAHLPEINIIVDRLIGLYADKEEDNVSTVNTLTVMVMSFSYKRGLPADPSGNGGGFIFDCRALPNPGRYPEYRAYTGKDRPVIEFLQREEAVDRFLDHAEALVSQSVDKYLERHFTSLQVSFGCTGGQHRSVYCAEQLASRLSARYANVSDFCIQVSHREQDK